MKTSNCQILIALQIDTLEGFLKPTSIAINKLWGKEVSKEVQTKPELQLITSQFPEKQWQKYSNYFHGIWLFSGSFSGHLFCPGFTANFRVRPGNSGSLGRYEYNVCYTINPGTMTSTMCAMPSDLYDVLNHQPLYVVCYTISPCMTCAKSSTLV